MNKRNFIYIAIIVIAMGCRGEQPNMDLAAQNGKQSKVKSADAVALEALIKEEEDLVVSTKFMNKFGFEAQGKTWQDVHTSYLQDMQTYANANPVSLRGLRQTYLLTLGTQGYPGSNLKLEYDGTAVTKDAILFYLQEMEQHKEPHPLVSLHFLQQIQKFLSLAETKKWAQKMVAWTNADYNHWKAQNQTFEAKGSMTEFEKTNHETNELILRTIQQIRLIAQN